MEVVGRRHHALVEHIQRTVFPGLHLVADNRHFRIEIFLQHGHVDHAVGFKAQRPTQVFVACVERFEIHGLVGGGLTVEVPASAVGEVFEDFRARLRTFERHVLQKVRHAGFAVSFIPRTHQVHDIHRDLGLGVVRKQQHVKTIREGILRHSLNGCHFLNALRQRLG